MGEFYFTIYNLVNNRAEALPIEVVSLAGDFNSWGDTEMVFDSEANTYSLTTDVSGGEVKVKFNKSWDYNLGGDVNALTFGGANIKLSEAGNYTFTLNLTNTATLTITKN